MSVNKKPKKKSSPAPGHSQVALLGGSYSLIISAVVLALLLGLTFLSGTVMMVLL